ncbi:MAG TPA: hypothetical protein PLH15_07520 [Spirochaetota bacterium]|nr:hypothetical protein [Spirochaetota bacterium]HPW52630.1 hypothetical protein [Spirochaetota bacterium]HQO21487.1 hypothetical protein [Spirochaetota bacterium]HQQ23674.1 hypothetical protein [Spirochaetota bacterium]
MTINNIAESGNVCGYIKYLAADYNISGITIVFIKSDKNAFSGVYSVNIVGDALYKFEFDSSVEKNYYMMQKAKRDFDIVPGNDKKIHDAFMSAFHEEEIGNIKSKIANKDTGAVAFEFRRIIANVLNSDDIKINAEFKTVSASEFLEIDAIHQSEAMTVTSKTALLRNIYGNDNSAIEQIVKNSIQDISYALATDSKTFAAAVFVSNQNKKMIASALSIDSPDLAAVFAADFFADFYSSVKKNEDAKLRPFASGDISSLCASVVEESEKGFTECLSPFLNKSAVEGAVRFGKINSIVLNSMIPLFSGKKSESASDDKNYRKTIDISLILSPTKGKKISELLPGDMINVMLDKNSPVGMKFINNLGLMKDDGTISPLSAEIYSVKRDVKNGFTVYVKLTRDLYGKTYEEEDIRIKTADFINHDVKTTSPRSLLIGIAAGAAVIIIIVLFLIFVI